MLRNLQADWESPRADLRYQRLYTNYGDLNELTDLGVAGQRARP